ncbi:hypothetical protein IWQ57_000281 [Coemansia nantahalensis]|uniref:Uncharacterized protein n=1 Tax=Coemansia nantahalensis TaxID=2789366 RepID=A0ACC1K896_9FUNG|nr:hypothetical protein IWQ57_000281 [Coemansia nantahalensis]
MATQPPSPVAGSTHAPTKVTRKASRLLQNHAFDGYKIAGRPADSKRPWWQPSELPEITVRRAVFFGLWCAIQIIVFVYWWVSWAQRRGSLRGFSVATMHNLSLSVSAIFLFMSPTLLELLRRTFISRHIVLEKNVHAHKVAAYTAAVWMVAHIITYYVRYHDKAVNSHGKVTFSHQLFGTMVGKTGHALLFLFFALYATSIPVIRRRFHELFYWMHHLFVPCVVLIFIHGKTHWFWQYFAGPGAIYTIDRLYRFVRSRSKLPRVLSVIQHPPNVIELRIERRGMNFQVGQYIYLNVPSISVLEWHPFTLTSSPEEDELSVHIWVGGGWTRRLIKLFQESSVTTLQADSAKVDSLKAISLHTDSTRDDKGAGQDFYASGPRPGTGAGRRPWIRGGQNSTVLVDQLPPELVIHNSEECAGAKAANRVIATQPVIKLPTIMVDGPYGAPTQQVFDYEHLVLVGGGIGVTPMSSVLKSLFFRLTERPDECRVRKVYFIWVCRSVQSLEWFRDLLVALDMEDIGDILEVRTYLTGQLPVDQIRNIALYQDPDGPDAVTGLHRSPTYYGRPNFSSILEDIGMRTPGAEVGVFACGPKSMSRSLRSASRKWTNALKHTTKTQFVFHQEKF